MTTNNNLRALVGNLRNRAKQSELRGHHSPEWCNGVRFAANEIDAAILDAEQPVVVSDAVSALPDKWDARAATPECDPIHGMAHRICAGELRGALAPTDGDKP